MCVQLAESQLFSKQRAQSCVYVHNNNYHQPCSPLRFFAELLQCQRQTSCDNPILHPLLSSKYHTDTVRDQPVTTAQHLAAKRA